MADVKDLPHLIALLEDESAVVQTELGRALCSLYESLPGELKRLKPPLSTEQENRVHSLLEPARREQLKQHWLNWRTKDSFNTRLEFGLECVARYQNGMLHPETVAEMIDDLVKEFRVAHPHTEDPIQLARYLFDEPGLSGELVNYYSPQNSNLVQVLKTGKGNPISLTCIFILSASRLGFDVEGCNYPGHFLARVKHRDKLSFVDCFSGGQVLDEELTKPLRQRTREAVRRDILQQSVSAETVLTRVLRNLINSYRLLGAGTEADLFLYLLKTTLAGLETPADPPAFRPGQLVRHRRYNYRGVVVDYDITCTADLDWYYSNQSQPDRNQPWYRVLVDGGNQITYAAQTSLRPDHAKAEVKHPLVAAFFSQFEGESYARNERPWPES